MRNIALPTLSALTLLGTMTSQAWAPNPGAIVPNVNVGKLVPDVPVVVPKVTPNINPNVLSNRPMPDLPLPPGIDVDANLLPDVPKVKSNYVILKEGVDVPALGGGVATKTPSAPMGQIPSRPMPVQPDFQPYNTVPPEIPPATNLGAVAPQLTPVTGISRLPPTPLSAGPSLPPRPDLPPPIKYSGLSGGDPPPVSSTGGKQGVRDALGDALANRELQDLRDMRRVPPEPVIINVPYPDFTPPKKPGIPKTAKVLLGVAGVGLAGGLVAVAVAAPFIVEEVTCEEFEGSADDPITGFIKGRFVTNANGQMTVTCDGSASQGKVVLNGNGVKPAECPSGSFYTTDASTPFVQKCDDDSIYTFVTPPSGDTMANGNPYPAGALLLKRVS